MKYITFLLVLLFVNTCEKAVPTSPDAIVTAITDDAIEFSDGTTQAFPKAFLDNSTIFFLVRHAEKESYGQDPDLTPEGIERANRLADILKNANLFKVYSTPYQRTINTAFPTIKALEIEHGSYDHNKMGDFLNTLIEHQTGKRFLIVGHSNTTPKAVNHLLGNSVYEDIDHEEYGKLFIVACKSAGDAEVMEVRY